MAEGLIYRRRVWTRQPYGGALADRLLPLGRGLVGLYGADRTGGLRNLVGTRGILTAGGSGSQYAATDRGHALRLNGSGYYQDQGFSLATTVGRTMACWVRMNALPASNANIIVWTDGTTVLSIEQLSISSSGQVKAESYRGGTAGIATTTGAVTIGKWHFIAAVMPSNASRTAWLDTESATVGTSASVLGADKWITIGAAPWASYTDTANADILLPMVWDRGLSAQEIAQARENSWRLIAPANSPVFYSLPGGGTSYTDSLTDTADASDSATTVLAALGTISDTGALTDTASSALVGVDALTDSGALTDSASSVLSAVSALADSAAASETITSVLVTTEALADSAAAADVTTGTVGAQSYTDLLTDAAALTDSFVANVVPIESASGGWDFFLRPIRHRDPPETLPEARAAVKTVVRKARKLRERADELAEEAAHLARQSEQRERTEATIAEMRSQVQQYEQIATQLRIHVELLIEQQREDDDLEILLLAA